MIYPNSVWGQTFSLCGASTSLSLGCWFAFSASKRSCSLSVENSSVPALGVDVVALAVEGFVFASDLLFAVALLFIILLMKISLMSISAAEALLSKEFPVPLAAAPVGSVAMLLLLLLGVLMLVTVVAMLLVVFVLFIVGGSEDGGVGGPLKADTKVALLKGELLLVRALAWLLMVLELLLPLPLPLLLPLPLPLPLLGFCSGMLSVSLSPPCFLFCVF